MLSSFKIETFDDILRALRERPEWLEELRRLILTGELIALPQKFENFVQMEFRPLKEKVDKIEVDTEGLKQDVAGLKQDVTVLKQDVAVLKQDVAELKGDNFERKVRERAPSYFGRLVRRCKVISFEGLAEVLEDAFEKGLINEKERDEALNVDIVASGFLKTEKEKKVLIVGEISIKADRVDVERAYERANVIGRAFGLSTIAVVIGKESTEGGIERAKELGVLFV